MFKTPLQSFRTVGYAEGTSFLVLLGIAMPLKYAAGIPQLVLVVGWIHGMLWMLYILAALRTSVAYKWSFGTLVWAGVASVMPFGPFVFDRYLRKKYPEAHSTRENTALR